MARDAVEAWIDRYVEIWRADAPERLDEIFTEDATYLTAPFRTPARGLAEIRDVWRATTDAGERFELHREVVAVDGAVAVVRLEVRYTAPSSELFRDLWILAFAEDGRARHFEEWPFSPPAVAGEPATG